MRKRGGEASRFLAMAKILHGATFRRNSAGISRSWLWISRPRASNPGKVVIWFQEIVALKFSRMRQEPGGRACSRGSELARERAHASCATTATFTAACPMRGTSAGHACDRANTGQMNCHFADIAGEVQKGGHAVVVLDGAGWHRSTDLEIPKGVSLLRLPHYSPELNSMENVFGHFKSNKLANRLYDIAEAVREAVLEAWTEIAGQSERIASVMTRQ
ncbi:MAG: transposase [Albidovulum sp.]|nr:transposase [Albidovulum sp.]